MLQLHLGADGTETVEHRSRTTDTRDTNCTPAHLQYPEGLRLRVRCVIKHQIFLEKIHKFNLQGQNTAMTATN